MQDDDSLTPAEAAKHWAAPPPQSALATIAILVLMVIIGVVLGLVPLAPLAYLYLSAPLTAEDFALASWLGSPSTALHFSGLVGTFLCAAVVVMGLGIAVARCSPWSIASGIILGMAIWLSSTETANVLTGVLNNTVKIGCYVPEIRECRVMLGLPTEGYQSRYNPDSTDAEWYTARRAEETKHAAHYDVAFSSMPMTPLVSAWFMWGRGPELQQKLQEQRAAVKQLQAQKP